MHALIIVDAGQSGPAGPRGAGPPGPRDGARRMSEANRERMEPEARYKGPPCSRHHSWEKRAPDGPSFGLAD